MDDLSTPNPPQRQKQKTKTKEQISQIFTAIRSRFAQGVVVSLYLYFLGGGTGIGSGGRVRG
jgi:hypothetical protein